MFAHTHDNKMLSSAIKIKKNYIVRNGLDSMGYNIGWLFFFFLYLQLLKNMNKAKKKTNLMEGREITCALTINSITLSMKVNCVNC
jgi:hypothetical protein